MNALINSLPSKDRDLLREVEPKRMAELDEDELLALHKRIRRARNKNVKNYRRGGAAGVSDKGGRGKSKKENTRSRDRAEAFEDALAQVSERLAVLAAASAEALKKERLAAARAGKSAGPQADLPDASVGSSQKARGAAKTTGGIKKDASSRATGARRQAAKDSRN